MNNKDTPPAEAREDGEAADRAIALNKGSPRKDRVAALERLSTPPAEAREPVGDAIPFRDRVLDAIVTTLLHFKDHDEVSSADFRDHFMRLFDALAQPQATPRDAEDADTKRLDWLVSKLRRDGLRALLRWDGRDETLRAAIDAMQPPTGEPSNG